MLLSSLRDLLIPDLLLHDDTGLELYLYLYLYPVC